MVNVNSDSIRRASLSISTRLFEDDFPEFKSERLMPINREMPSGAAALSLEDLTTLGGEDDAYVDDFSDDSPGVDVGSEERLYRKKIIRRHYDVNWMDMERQKVDGVDRAGRRAKAALDRVRRDLEKHRALGNADRNIGGLLNSDSTERPNLPYGFVSKETVANGAAASPLWSTKTSAEIVVDISEAVNQMISDTNGIEPQDGLTLLLPDNHLALLQEKYNDNTDTPLINQLRVLFPMITAYEAWHYCKATNFSTSVNRFVLYQNSADKLESIQAMDPTPFGPFQRSMFSWRTEIMTMPGDFMIHKPKAILYREGI